MVKLTLAFAVGSCYAVALWFFQSDLHSSVPLVSFPLWFVLLLRAGGFYGLLVFLAYYLPQLRVWLLGQVQDVIESEDW